MRKKRTNSKKPFVQEGAYQNWTNSFSRMSVLWDQNNDLKPREKSLKHQQHEKEYNRCDSPDKSRSLQRNCSRLKEDSPVRSSQNIS